MQILEAFRALNALNEDIFSLDAEGVEKLSNFTKTDDLEDDVQIIDPEAETKDDLQDNYIGKVILDCCVCHSKLYKDPSEVDVDETGELANVGEECPYCFTPDGFKVIGEVVPFGGSAEDDNNDDSDEIEEVLDFNVPVNVTANGNSVAVGGQSGNSKNESLSEGIFGIKTKKEKAAEEKARREREAKKRADREAKEEQELARQQFAADSWASHDKNKRDAERAYNRNRYNSIKGDKPSNTGYRGVNYSGGDYYESLDNELEEGIFDKFKKKKNDSSGSSQKRRDLRKETQFVLVKFSESGRAIGLEGQGTMDDYGFANRMAQDNLKYMKNGEYQEAKTVAEAEKLLHTDLTDILENFKAHKGSNLEEDASDRFISPISHEPVNKSHTAKSSTEHSDKSLSGLGLGSKEERDHVWAVFDEYGEYVCAYPTQIAAEQEAKNMWKAKVKKVMLESLNEDIQDLSMTANDTHIEVSEEENGKVTVSMEPATNAAGGEMVAPVSPEAEEEIMADEEVEDPAAEEPAEDAPAEEEAPEEGAPEEGADAEIDADFDEFDEESMDGLGESYFRRVYENVNSFKTTAVKTSGNSMIIEGLLEFNSGNKKNTSFIFEALDATKNGRFRFVGDNKELTEGKKAFMLTGTIKNNKLMVESMNYNYKHTDSEGKTLRVYGTERIK